MRAITVMMLTTAGLAGVAAAEPVNLVFVGTGLGQSINVRTFSESGEQLSARNLFAGELIHNISGGTGEHAMLNGEFATFCADITEGVSLDPEAEFEVVSLETIPVTNGLMPQMGEDKADAIRSIFTEGAARQRSGSMSSNFAAAFQLMIWEIVADFDAAVGAASLDARAGTLRFSNRSDQTLTAGVQSEFDALRTRVAAGDDLFTGLLGLASAGLQDQLVVVPTPATAALAGLGALFVARRRRA